MNKVFLNLIILLIWLNCRGVVISETQIIGNDRLTTTEILSVTKYKLGDELDRQKISETRDSIKELYQEKGIIFVNIEETEVIPLSPSEVKVVFKINEYQLNDIADLVFTGNYVIKDQILLDLFYLNDYTFANIKDFQYDIIDQYAQRGYFFTQIKVDSITESDQGAILKFQIEENKPFKHNFYEFRGNKTSKDYSLIKIARLEHKETITPNQLAEAEKRLLSKSYIKKCSIRPLDNETLLFDIEEGQMTTISGIMGYNSNNKDYPINGFVDFSFENLFGNDRILQFSWNKLQRDRTDIELFYHETAFKNRYFSADFSLQRTEYDTLAIYSQAGITLNYDFINQRVGIYSNYHNYEILSNETGEETEKTVSLGSYWQQNTYDNSLNPRSGHLIQLSLDHNMSSLDNDNYNISKATFSKVLALADDLIIYNRINANYSTKKDLSSYNSFKLGGFTSLRGFQEEQFSGYFVGWNNLEIRYLFGLENNIFLFADAGYLESSKQAVTEKKGNLYSAGLGLRIATGIGNLTFEYGLGYNQGWSSLYDGLIHFGLETSF